MADKYKSGLPAVAHPPQAFSSGKTVEGTSSIVNNDESSIKAGQSDARSRQLSNRALIHSAFPSQGTEQPSYMGSQSMAPGSDQ
jgi:hypothetical protein